MPTLAAVDIGSNSVRLKIARLTRHRLTNILEDREVTRLGASVFRSSFLSPEAIAELVQMYRDGASTTQLRKQYELGQGSVIKILHEHGVVMRNQGLGDNDLALAATLYRDGTTLAQLGERFGVSPNAVRRALVAANVVMRARGGSRARG